MSKKLLYCVAGCHMLLFSFFSTFDGTIGCWVGQYSVYMLSSYPRRQRIMQKE